MSSPDVKLINLVKGLSLSMVRVWHKGAALVRFIRIANRNICTAAKREICQFTVL